MADNVREVLRAAQAAELGGDKARAIELLRRASRLCHDAGNDVRAEQLLRYALRLDPSRTDLEAEIARLSAPPPPPPSAPGTLEPEPDVETWAVEEDPESLQAVLREAERAVERREAPVAVAVEGLRSVVTAAEPRRDASSPEPGGQGEGAFIERGPTRADPALEAWCSFCCRPRAEVGPLVAGPAGAFICSACTGESGALLGGVTPKAASSRASSTVHRPVTFEVVGQTAVQERLELALRHGVRRLLLLGVEGCGKSAWARMLVEQERGVLVTPDGLDHAAVSAWLLVEDVDRLPPDEQAMLGAFLARHPQRTVLMTARGAAPASGPVLVSDEGRLPVPTTAALAEATGGAVPRSLLEQVQGLVPLETPGVEDWKEIARRRLASREDCQLSEEALTALATEAAGSPRKGHELEALLARVPPGRWRLEDPKPPKPVRRTPRKGKS